MSKRVVAAAVACALLCGAATQADVVFNFNIEFSGATTPAGPAPWLIATFSDAGTDKVKLTMDASPLAADNAGSFVGAWYFNFTPEGDVDDLVFTWDATSDTEAGSVGHIANNFKADGDGKYDILFDFTSKLDAGETSVYTIMGTGITPESFNVFSENAGGNGPFLSAAHVQGLGDDNQGSGWLAGELIPLPSGAAMATAGFGLVILRRRR